MNIESTTQDFMESLKAGDSFKMVRYYHLGSPEIVVCDVERVTKTRVTICMNGRKKVFTKDGKEYGESLSYRRIWIDVKNTREDVLLEAEKEIAEKALLNRIWGVSRQTWEKFSVEDLRLVNSILDKYN